PMNAIIGLSHLVMRTSLTPRQMDYLQKISGAAATLLRLINDILDFSKIESGKMVLEETVFDLRQVMEDTMDTLRSSAQQKGLSLELLVEPELPNCFVGDPTRLQQVLMNLVGNAIKFTPRGGVTLSVRPAGTAGERHRVGFAVRDTGIGIPEARLEAIFESFTQADTSTTRTFGGTGLGVTIAKEIVDRMEGRLRVTSRVGEGSTFFFEITLPLAPVRDCRRELPTPGAGRRARRLFTVLLVEDLEENIVLARLRLERLGHKVLVAHDGIEALTLWQQEIPDLILMDLQMPNMDGFSATRAIREREAAGGAVTTRVPIIAMTAAAMKGDQEACLAAGMDDYVSKPIEFVRLSVVMERVVPRGVGRLVEGNLEALSDAVDESDLPAEWQGLPGIDVAVGLAKWGNGEVYRKTLIGFARKHAEDAALLRDALAREDLPGAKSIAHAMKGAAGTLAATGLEAAAMTLDAALRQRKEESGDMHSLLAAMAKRNVKLEDLVADFASHLERVIDSCQRLEPDEKCVPAGLAEEESVRKRRLDGTVIARMRAIAHHLSHGDVSGVEQELENLQAARVLRQADMDLLLEQVDELELDQALATLIRISGYFEVDLDQPA
ncbi:MAG: response regulator, partial [Magnetococcales bacterium]|nr:response regulator [Magnetococcales bacterium]